MWTHNPSSSNTLVDINECLDGNGGCEVITSTSYVAYLALLDYTTVIVDVYSLCFLADIDECENDNAGCAQLCNNTIGNSVCDCYSGYLLDEDEFACYDNASFKHQSSITTCSYYDH